MDLIEEIQQFSDFPEPYQENMSVLSYSVSKVLEFFSNNGN